MRRLRARRFGCEINYTIVHAILAKGNRKGKGCLFVCVDSIYLAPSEGTLNLWGVAPASRRGEVQGFRRGPCSEAVSKTQNSGHVLKLDRCVKVRGLPIFLSAAQLPSGPSCRRSPASCPPPIFMDSSAGGFPVAARLRALSNGEGTKRPETRCVWSRLGLPSQEAKEQGDGNAGHLTSKQAVVHRLATLLSPVALAREFISCVSSQLNTLLLRDVHGCIQRDTSWRPFHEP